MKKILCALLSLMLCMGCAAADGAAIVNPDGYEFLRVTDIFTNDDSEIGENGEEIPHAESLTVQGVFGAFKYPSADDTAPAGESEGMETLGFDPENTVSLTLAADCEILMPADLTNPVENVSIDDLQAWYDAANERVKADLAEGESRYAFYATFEMNDEGELTKLEYCYFEWN